MTFPQTPRHVEIRSGGQIVAAAEVSMPAAGTARTSLHAAAGHVAPGWRTDLVDAVLDLPEVRASERLEATVPIGDGEFLDRLRERTTGAVTRPAGSTVLLDAIIPPQRRPENLVRAPRGYGALIVAPCVTSSESGGTRSTPSGSDR
jgi:hypothetical protein